MEKQNRAETTIHGRVVPFKQDGEYFYQRGLKAYQHRDLYKAVKMFEKAVSFHPDVPEYLAQLASTLAEVGEYEKSNEYLLEALAFTEDDFAECHYFLANNYAHLGLFSEAERHALLYMEHDPDGEFIEDSQELLDLINFETGGKSNLVLSEEDELLTAHEEARRLIEQGKLPEAQDQLRRIIRNHPSFWAAYNNLALTHFYRNEFNEALTVLQDLLEKNPGNLNALCNLAIFFYHLGMVENGRVMVERLKGIHPIHPEHRYKLGNTFGLLEEHEHANKWLLALRKTSFSLDPVATHALAVSYYALGKPSLAMKYWKKAAELDRDGKIASYYMMQAESGTLTIAGSDYQYRIPAPNAISPKHNKMSGYMEKLQQIRQSAEKSKLTHLFLLRGNKNEESYELLKEICLREEEPLLIKELAINIMLEHQPQNPVRLNHNGNEAEVSSSSPILLSAFEMIDCLKAHGAPIDEYTLLYWTGAIYYAKDIDSRILGNVEAVAAAVDYMARKMKGKATQKAAAELYGISASVLSLRVKKLGEWMRENV